MDFVILGLHIAVLLLVLFAAYEDVRFMRIRNTIALGVAALFIPMIFILPMHQVLLHVAVGAVVFSICVVLFFMRVFGGGDAKLIGALALWPTLDQLPTFLMVTTIAGGFLALAALALRNTKILSKMKDRIPSVYGPSTGWFASLARGETVVPYGVAIAIATAITLF